MNTTENNKLIAEFMGLKKYGYKDENYLVLSKHLSSEQLPYNTSWDWLMPVVKKCFNIDNELAFDYLADEILTLDIDETYKGIIEFIEDYIKQKTMTTENNKLIAEFMGGVISTVPNLINLPQNRGDANIYSVKGSEVLPNGTYSVHRLNELKYHDSWDWLIPVIENIDHLQHEPVMSIENALSTRSIDNTYKAVIEFIKEYNN